MKKQLCYFLLLLCAVCISACKEEAPTAKENAIYLDENGYYDFGPWAGQGNLNMNGEYGWAALYLMTEEETRNWLDEAYMEDTTVEEQKQDWETILVGYAMLPDEMLTTYFYADEEGIKKFRAYAEDYLSSALEKEAQRSDDPALYHDDEGNYDIGSSWEPIFKEDLEKNMTLFAATDEEIIAYMNQHSNEVVYNAENGEPETDPEQLRQSFGHLIIYTGTNLSRNLSTLYDASAEDIERFRTYYAKEFCGR